MPRSDSKGSTSDSYSPTLSNASMSSASAAAAQKKKHVCPTCDRAFTTSGHLARHSRVHTGEKNHKCPFPGCETRCSRQDNLQQHYRIHLSPGSRRTSSRSASRSSRGVGSRRGANSGLAPSSAFSSPDSPPALASALPIPPPPLSPPPLEQAHANGPHGRLVYVQHSPPPDSPPPLAQATLPATLVHQQQQSQFMLSRSSNSASPDSMYANSSFASGSNISMSSMNGQSTHSPTVPNPGYPYRVGTSTYQEQATGASGGYTYVHTTPVSNSNSSDSNYSSNPHSLPHINTLHAYNSRPGSPSLSHNSSAPVSAAASPLSSVSSRHSISHISHAQSYPPLHNQSSLQSIGHSPSPVSANSNSPHGQMLPSVSSLSSSLSNPPTPTTYSGVYQDSSSNDNLGQSQHQHYDNGLVNHPPPSTSSSPHTLPATSNANYSPALSVHSSGSPDSMPNLTQPLSQHPSGQGAILGPSLSRYNSPPPVLAPITGYAQGNEPRLIEERYVHGHGSGPRSYSDHRYETQNQNAGGYGYRSGGRYSDGDYLGHQPTVPSNAYGGYGGTMNGVNLGHGAWKADSGLGRSMKGIGALVQ